MVRGIYINKFCEVVYGEKPCPEGRNRRAWSHVVLLKNTPGRQFEKCGKSKAHVHAALLLTNTSLEAGLSTADRDENDENI